MFNLFNFGARPTPSIPKVSVLRDAAHPAARKRGTLLHSLLRVLLHRERTINANLVAFSHAARLNSRCCVRRCARAA